MPVKYIQARSAPRVPVTFDRWHPVQERFILSPAKRKVIAAGRRGGKTTGMANLALATALALRVAEDATPAKLVSPSGVPLVIDERRPARRVLEAAPTSDQTLAFWEHIKRLCDPLLSAGLADKSETYRLIEFWNGSRIRTKTAWDADSLRGDYADLLILDEYSYMDPSAWETVGAPMLLDNDGDAAFIFSPNRRNHAYAHYVRAEADTTGRWAAYRFTSLDNPYLSAVALAEITQDMTEDDYDQEILAQFLENTGAVFRHINRAMRSRPTVPAEHQDHDLVMGVDWGKQVDYTVLSVGCATCRREVALDRFKEVGYILQRGRLAAMAALWNVGYIVVESNSIGEPNLEMLQAEGLPAEGFATTSSSKGPLIDGLALAIERATPEDELGEDAAVDETSIGLMDDRIAKAELEAYEVKISPVTSKPTYSAPEGVHDDTVIARALMVRAMNSYTPALI